MDVRSVPAQSFREKHAEYFAAVKGGVHVALTRYGTTVGVVVPLEDYRRAMFALQAVDGIGQHAEQQQRADVRNVQQVSSHVFRRDQADYLDEVEKRAAYIAVTRYKETLGVVLPFADYDYAMFAIRIMDGLARLAESDGPNDLQAFAALVDEKMSQREDRDGQQEFVFKEVAKAS